MRFEWLREINLIRMREIADRTLRYIEDLDAVCERAQVTHEKPTSTTAEHMSRIMYFLPIVTDRHLSTFGTSHRLLLGTNVGGMPGAENPVAFWTVCGILGGVDQAALNWKHFALQPRTRKIKIQHPICGPGWSRALPRYRRC